MKGPSTLTVGEALTLSTRFLAEKGSPSARLDAQILIAHTLGIRRLDLYLSPERPLSESERDCLRKMLARRGQMEPVAYITGQREFFGLMFKVTADVLIPRPETETVVDAAMAVLAACGADAPKAADIGTGSGAIACTIATRMPDVKICAGDISGRAIAVARENADLLGVSGQINFVESDLFESTAFAGPFDLIVSNPPYIATTEDDMVDESAKRFEPRAALFSGTDGTDCTFRLIDGAFSRLKDGGVLLIEIGSPAQQARVAQKLLEKFNEINEVKDPAGITRGLMAVRT